jgi:hypothetical protein
MAVSVVLYASDAYFLRLTAAATPPTLLEIGSVKIAAGFPELIFLLSFLTTLVPLGYKFARKRGWVS